jgi:hypothetical protein
VSLFRRLAFIVAALVGVVFLIVGVVSLVSLTWNRATGVVTDQCAQQRTTTGPPGSSSRTTHYTCSVTWSENGVTYQADIDLGSTRPAPGTEIALRVHRGSVVVDSPAWVGAGVTVVGLAVLAGTVILWRRSRHKST